MVSLLLNVALQDRTRCQSFIVRHYLIQKLHEIFGEFWQENRGLEALEWRNINIGAAGNGHHFALHFQIRQRKPLNIWLQTVYSLLSCESLYQMESPSAPLFVIVGISATSNLKIVSTNLLSCVVLFFFSNFAILCFHCSYFYVCCAAQHSLSNTSGRRGHIN